MIQMPKIQIHLDEETNKIVEVYQALNNMVSKDVAINKMIRELNKHLKIVSKKQLGG
jgi:Protein of unknown function (DUF2683)